MNKILSYAFLALFPLLASCSNVPQELPVVAEEALPKPVEGAAVQEPRRPIILNADRILSVWANRPFVGSKRRPKFGFIPNRLAFCSFT